MVPGPGPAGVVQQGQSIPAMAEAHASNQLFQHDNACVYQKNVFCHCICDFTIYFTIDMCRFRTCCGFPTVGMLISPMPAASAAAQCRDVFETEQSSHPTCHCRLNFCTRRRPTLSSQVRHLLSQSFKDAGGA